MTLPKYNGQDLYTLRPDLERYQHLKVIISVVNHGERHGHEIIPMRLFKDTQRASWHECTGTTLPQG